MIYWVFAIPVLFWIISGLRVIQEYESGVIFRLGRFAEVKRAGLNWIVPGVDNTQIGVAARRPARPDLGQLLLRLKTVCDIREIKVVARRSGLIPSGGTLRHLGTNRVLLIGDAAGMVSPVTGGGIHTALHFGRRAALTFSVAAMAIPTILFSLSSTGLTISGCIGSRSTPMLWGTTCAWVRT